MSRLQLMPAKTLVELLEAQREMDNLALQNADPISEQERFDNIQIATMIELAEMMNEIETFKFWKKQRNKRNFLEESVDALHFILSLINQLEDLKYSKTQLHKAVTMESMEEYPNENQMYKFICNHVMLLNLEDDQFIEDIVRDALKGLLVLQRIRGYELEDVKEAYYAKHEVNLKRQKENY